MSRACSTRGREEKFDENLVGNMKEREGLEDDKNGEILVSEICP